MKKTKLILAPNSNLAKDYAIRNKLELKEWVYLTRRYQLEGLDSKTIEIVYLDGWWLNSLYDKSFDDVILYHTILGAKKTYA
jgi:hypothetical protein